MADPDTAAYKPTMLEVRSIVELLGIIHADRIKGCHGRRTCQGHFCFRMTKGDHRVIDLDNNA